MLKFKTPVIRIDCLIKSDRINVLRKQYDSFLEEDKKRKERNDYILGRLDHMRYSSTAVQVRARHTPSTCSDYFMPTYSRYANRPENVEPNNMQLVHMNQEITRPNYHNFQLDVPRNIVEENSILKEISKKYILIPKLRPTFPNVVPEVTSPLTPTPISTIKTNDMDNSDWKSKYDILEHLKKKEKDEETNKYAHSDINHLDTTIDHDQVIQNYAKEELPTSYEEEIPEKDVSDQLLVENELKGLDKLTIPEKKDQIPSTGVARTPATLYLNPENAAPFYGQTQNEVIEEHSPHISTVIDHQRPPEQYDIPAENIAVATSQMDSNQYQDNYPEQEAEPQQEYPVEYEQFMPSTEVDTNHTQPETVINQEENDYSPVEVFNPSEVVDELIQDNNVQDVNETENEYPTKIANTQEFSSEEAKLVLQEGQEINPENYITDDETIVQGNPVPQMLTDAPTDDTGIEEFDAEQREMFYSEQTGENNNYAYDQGAAGDAYNEEYAQNQNYPQDQDYAYYEGAVQEEGAYPVEINEHEETQQLYDQHYEQQYATNYEQGYEQQAVYMEQDANQQEFQQPALYDQAQQELDQYTDEQPAETQDQVEQVLDSEDGYIQKVVESPTTQDGKETAELTVP